VTTYDAGMAVPDWPSTYGYNLFLYPWSTWLAAPWDLFIEHGHRLLGALSGMLTLALLAVVWRTDSRRWLKALAVLALLLVVAQGLLGGMRVRLDSNVLARLHGCTGPLFFALTVALCVFTSPFWQRAGNLSAWEEDAALGLGRRIRRVVGSAWLLVAWSYVQLVLGAHLRHPNYLWSPAVLRGVIVLHVALAIVLVISSGGLALRVFGLLRAIRRSGSSDGHASEMALRWPATAVGVLIGGQFLLGMGAWTVKYGWPRWLPGQTLFANLTLRAESMGQALTVTAHVAAGSLFLATAVWLAVRATRLRHVLRRPAELPVAYKSSGDQRVNGGRGTSHVLVKGVIG